MQCAVGALLTSIPLWYCEQFHCSPTLSQSDTVCFPMLGVGELLPFRKTPSSASASALHNIQNLRLPITPGILLRIKEGWEKEPLVQDKTMLWAAMLLCFFGFFRSGEICAPPSGSFNDRDHLTFADVLVDNPTNPHQLHILLKRSKTDQAGKGAIVGNGRTGASYVP